MLVTSTVQDGVTADAPPQTQALVRQVRDSVATLFRDEGPPGQIVGGQGVGLAGHHQHRDV